MTEADVLQTHTQTFHEALKGRDLAALSALYSDDYMLVRPNGSVLSKDEVLRDLDGGGLTFQEIELTDAKVRIHSEAALLTGVSRTVSTRAGEETTARFRLIAVYVKSASGPKLVHFQSVLLP
jgi:ketosteroid isomerase-like protein